MLDLRPVAYVIGLLVAALGVAMLLPMAMDWWVGNGHWRVYLQCGLLLVIGGGLTALACASGTGRGLNLQQIFVLTTGVWVVLPLVGALPLMAGEPYLGFTDAYFEAMSGMTTTGTTVITGIENLPPGVNLWRCILQWVGGLGIVIVAMLFLPVMKVGGMQFFRSEGFDTLGKVLPRAMDISAALVQIYIVLTLACTVTFLALGMTGFEAVSTAMSAISTGGYAVSDASFANYGAGAQYSAAVFMILGSLPFVRFIQAMQGDLKPLWRDPQVRAYLRWIAYAVGAVTLYEVLARGREPIGMLQEATFNIVSVFSGTGFTSADLTQWGTFPFVILIITGLIGGCTSSTGCSVKVFRYLILFEAIRVQIRRLQNPSSVVIPRYQGRTVDDDVLNSVIVFFTMFILTLGVLTVGLSMTGLSTKSAITAAWTAIANVGVVFGPEVGSSGAVHAFPASAKWLMIAGMLVGRLELLSVYVLLMPRFWRG
ncbi:MAG: TrkH family potassium uptake protein [Paracoccaceae bacterium]